MDLNEYQENALKTDKYPNASDEFLTEDEYGGVVLGMLYTLGLVGEAGEVADKIKKIYRDKQGQFNDEDIISIIKEIGDVMWYCAALSRHLGWELEDVAKMNIEKLTIRAQNNKIHGSGDNR